MVYAIISFLSFSVASIATYVLARASGWFRVLDVPNERSLHSKPVPRTGGIAIICGIATGSIAQAVFFEGDIRLASILFASMIIAVVSLVDDRVTLTVGIRLAVHGLTAVVLVGTLGVLHGMALPGSWLSWPKIIGTALTILTILWLTNLYNFMDGIDGLAAGMGVVGFSTFAVLGGMADHPTFSLLSLVIAAAAAGFLVFNFPPARIFMGDVGSSTLGFLVAAFTLWAALDGIFPLWIGILVFGPFVVDATVTLLRRAMCGERVWTAHKSHYYQRLVQAGWGHRKTVLLEYLLMTGSGITAVVLVNSMPTTQWAGILCWAVIYVVGLSAVEFLCETRSVRQGNR